MVLRKVLLFVYKYDGSHQVNTKIVEEGKHLAINPFHDHSYDFHKDRLDCTCLDAIRLETSKQKRSNDRSLVILGAAYGLENVTWHAKHLLSYGEFKQFARNDVWKDTWKGVTKTLVVVYTYDGLEMLDVVKENELMHFIASPPMKILYGAYGLTNVTNKIRSLVKNRSLTVTANNETFDDGWPDHKKTLVVTYQYGGENPVVAIAKENEKLEILYSKRDIFVGPTDPTILTILAAAYGPKDVTRQVQNLAKNGSLKINVENDVLGGDPWHPIKKSLVVVYQYGRDMPLMEIAPEHKKMSVSKKVPTPFAGLVDASNLLHHGDIIALSAINGKYISCDSKNMLVAVEAIPDDICAMIVEKKDGQKDFKIRCSNNRKYVTVGTDSALYAAGSAEEATMFSISISLRGGLRVATVSRMFINFDSDDNCLRANCVDYFGVGTVVDVAIKQTSSRLPQFMANAEYLTGDPSTSDDCRFAWASFIWKLTGGFYLAIGLGPFISTGRVQPGVYWLIRSNPRAWTAVYRLYQTIIDEVGRDTLVCLMIGVIGVLYYEGLLWTVFKVMMKAGVWFVVTWALAKIIQIVLLPEAEAAELLASFTVWGVQTVQAGLELSRACS